MTFIYTILLFLFLTFIFRLKYFIRKWIKKENERYHDRNEASRTAHTTYTHTHICTHQQRRTTLVVDLQDKYYSEKLDYRYRPPPNANNYVSTDRFQLPITCVRTRAKNFRGYHPDLLQSFPFLLCAPDRDTTRIFGISQPQGAILT